MINANSWLFSVINAAPFTFHKSHILYEQRIPSNSRAVLRISGLLNIHIHITHNQQFTIDILRTQQKKKTNERTNYWIIIIIVHYLYRFTHTLSPTPALTLSLSPLSFVILLCVIFDFCLSWMMGTTTSVWKIIIHVSCGLANQPGAIARCWMVDWNLIYACNCFVGPILWGGMCVHWLWKRLFVTFLLFCSVLLTCLGVQLQI